MIDATTLTPAQAVAALVMRRRLGPSSVSAQASKAARGPSLAERLLVKHREATVQAVRRAARHSWLALEIALADKPVRSAVSTPLSAGDAKAFRQQTEALLDLMTLAGLPAENPGTRRRCFEELRSGRQAGLCAVGDLDAPGLDSGTARGGGYQTTPSAYRNGTAPSAEPGDAERRVLGEVTDALRQAGYPQLARVVGLRLPWDDLLFLEVVAYFLRRTLRMYPVLRKELPDLVEDSTGADWRCLEMLARVLEERADAVEELLDGADEAHAAADASGRDDEAVEHHFQQGLTRYLLGDYPLAVLHFTAGLKLDPTDSRLYAHRGDAHRLQGQHERAIADFEAALRLDPGHPAVLVSRAGAYQQCSEPRRALADCQAALEGSPKNAAAYRIRAAAHAELGSPDLALADLTAAITLAPEDEEAYYQRGVLHLGRRAFRPAVEDFTRVLKLNPHRVSAYEQRGHARRCLREYSAAVRDFSEALRRHPRSVAALAGRGSAYRLQGDLAQAHADYEQAMLLDPTNAQVRCSQGLLFRLMGDLKRAEAELDESLRLQPRSWAALYHRGKVLLLQGRLTEALADLTAALECNCRALAIYLSRAIVHDRLGQYAEAIADATQALALTARSPAASLVRGMVRNHMGDYEAAVADLTEAIRLDRRLALAYHERSIAHTARQDYRRALADCDKLLTLEGSNAQAYALRSVIYQCFGDVQKALEDYNRAMQLDPLCLMPALNQGLAEDARRLRARRLADYIDGLRPEPASDEPPLPPPFRIALLPWHKGLEPCPHTGGGDPEPLVASRAGARRGAVNGTTIHTKAAPTQEAPTPAPTSTAPAYSVPEVTLSSSALDRPVWRPTSPVARRRDEGDEEEDEESTSRSLWRRPVFRIVAGIAALVLLCVGLWLNRSDQVRVYPAHGEAFVDGKPLANATIWLDPVWTKALNFPRPHAFVKDDGSFVLGTYGKDDGAPAGEYRVSVQWLVKTDKVESEGGKLPVNLLPSKYGSFETSGLRVQIHHEETVIPALQLKR